MTLPTNAIPHPAPHAPRVRILEISFIVFGGPAAWFLQLCAGYALASGPCFREGVRLAAPKASLSWSGPAMIAVMVAALAVALIALVLAWRAYVETRGERAGGASALLEAGAGRTRFLAFWGVVYGAGFAVATAVTVVAFMALPRCAG
ncbi:MAG TPA: hypothetical protein VHV81_01375 [Steroidobacteraceae bacterium]|jgi:hypothetical protein|nr:hypothetical protein [Steroidobacteraceae bacterium]